MITKSGARTVVCALVVIGSLWATLLMCLSVAGPHALERQTERVAKRSIPANNTLSKISSPPPGTLLAQQVRHRWGRDTITRVLIVGGETKAFSAVPLPPGVRKLPLPGEAIVSPALLRESQAKALADIMGTTKIAGVIGADGLRTPDEMFVYQGVDRSDMTAPVLVEEFGRTAARDGTTQRLLSWSLAIFVLAPATILFAVAARSFAGSRERQLRALRLIGASPYHLRVLVALDLAIYAGIGSLLGGAAFVVARPRLSSIPGVGEVFVNDLKLPVTVIALVVFMSAVFAGIVAVATTGRAARPVPGTRPTRRSRIPSAWTLVPLTASAVALVVLSLLVSLGISSALGPTFPLLWYASTTGLALGLPLGAGRAVHLAASRFAAGGGVVRLLALRRLSFMPAGQARLAGTLGAALFLIASGAAYANLFPTPADPPRLANGGFPVEVVGADGGPLPASFHAETVGRSATALPVIALQPVNPRRGPRTGIVATCQQIRLFLPGTEHCPTQPVAISTSPGDDVRLTGQRFRIRARDGDTLVVAENALRPDAALEFSWMGSILIPATAVDLARLEPRSYWLSVGSRAELESLRITLAAASPAAVVLAGDHEDVRLANQQAISWLVLCVVVATALLSIALALSSLDVQSTSGDFRARLAPLSAPRHVVLRAQLLDAAAPSALSVGVGVAFGTLGGVVISSSVGEPVPWGVYSLLLLGGIALAVVLALLSVGYHQPRNRLSLP